MGGVPEPLPSAKKGQATLLRDRGKLVLVFVCCALSLFNKQ